MRWTGWILAAIVVGCLGQANAGQPCVGCAGGTRGFGQPELAALGGDACFSPNGYSGNAPLCGAGCNDRPCCQNAWDGYCERKARLQSCCPPACNGVRVRWIPCIRQAAPECTPPNVECTPQNQKSEPTPAASPVRRVPPVDPAPAVEASPPTPSELTPPSEEAFKQPNRRRVR